MKIIEKYKSMMTQNYVFNLILFYLGFIPFCIATKPPHIIFILADDLGWNDVSYHGSDEIPTPNIDALAYSGIILNRHYGMPVCTPSRASFLTGKYPIHIGMQHGLIGAGEPRGLPLNEKLLPQYLNDIGYESHIVGKWHLGFFRKEYTPTYRGFKTHLGYWNGYQDYYDHSVRANLLNKTVWGLDMRRNMDVAWDLSGKYSTNIYTNESINIINNHNSSNPLFLYVAQVAPHTGSPYNPNAVPDEVAALYANITDYDRGRYSGMIKILDDGIGRIFEALYKNRMLDNSIIVFSSDNGGPVKGYMDRSTASNWPLRGSKRTLWEGGVRLASFIWSRLLKNPSTVSSDYIHLTDWIPTFLSAANKSLNLKGLDGISHWDTLSKGDPPLREEILLNIDPLEKERYGALIKGNWKIIKGRTTNGKYDEIFEPKRHNAGNAFMLNKIKGSKVSQILRKIGITLSDNKILKQRKSATVQCNLNHKSPCQAQIKPCLFDIHADPCETNDLSSHDPSTLKYLEDLLDIYGKEQVPPSNMEQVERADPAYHNYIWTNYYDNSSSRKSHQYC